MNDLDCQDVKIIIQVLDQLKSEKLNFHCAIPWGRGQCTLSHYLSHFGGKRLEKLQIRQNWPFRVILSHFGGKSLEKLWIRQNWLFWVILSLFCGKRLEKLQIGWNWPFQATSVGKDWKSCNSDKIQLSLYCRGQKGFKSINQPGWSPEVERNPKMSISFFWLERGGGWGSSLSTSPANHQKLNVIQKWAFHFFGWRGVVDGVWVHQPAWQIIRSWT